MVLRCRPDVLSALLPLLGNQTKRAATAADAADNDEENDPDGNDDAEQSKGRDKFEHVSFKPD